MSARALDGGFRFENFVVGASNRLAHSAAHAVATAPGRAYNPLVIYGPSGLGKTHLVAAIAYQARQSHPGFQVEFATGEEIVERLSRAVSSGQRDRFTEQYRETQLLLLDDVQFLTGQRETQHELLRLCNQMQAEGRQLVMTSDRAPSEIPDLDQRLLSRLAGGLVVDVGTPDFEMRLAILRNTASERELAFDDGVLAEVARLPLGNVRELKGALNRLAAFQQLEDAPVRVSDVRAVLGEAVVATPVARATPSATPVGDAADFFADVVQEVEERVERWRVTLGEACTFWRADGIATHVLERALRLPAAPDINGLLATFAAAVEHLRALEAQAVTLDPSLRGHPAFRDPERVGEAEALLDRALAHALPLPRPHPSLRRDALEVGQGNQLAVKAADAVVEQPGKRYSPLFVHGTDGTGKTHLLHAIGNAILAVQPRCAMACLSATVFVEELVAAMQEGGVERWRARYRAADVFLLDDVQHLAERERTQEELFHLFNALQDRGAQIVLAGDRAPHELPGIADRLRSRFAGGLVVALQPPDRALREKLVRRWLRDAGHRDEPALVSYLADRPVAGTRELAGLVTRCAAAAELLAVPLDLPLVRRELEGLHAVVSATPRGAPRLPDGAVDSTFLDAEKIAWEWPDLSERLVEEWG